MKIKRYLYILVCFVSFLWGTPDVQAQQFALKSNLLYDLTATLNVGAELRFADLYTVGLTANYNPWTYGNNKKMKQLLLMPEVKRYFEDAFLGMYVGAHAFYGWFNWGGIAMDYRYQGKVGGAGLSVGYQWMLSPFWNLELSGGLGYARFDSDKYAPEKDGIWMKQTKKNYIGPTQIGISLVYFIQ